MQIGLGLWLGTRQVGGFDPAAVLFGAGEQGGWYDSSDLSTMFQDSAGTTPVTATGQTVARINDKSGRGNHLTQATAASRPIYGIEPFGGRRNLLTYTEQFDNAAWVKARVAVTANAVAAPDGTLTADTVVEDTGTGAHYLSQAVTGTSSGNTYTASVYAKPAGRNWIILELLGDSTYAFFNVETGVVGTTSGSPTATITPVGNGWYRCLITKAVGSAITALRVYNASADNTTSYTGDGTSGIFLWGAQLELGSLATPYQRVTDQWNVTEAGVPSVSYVQYDGTDDWFISPTITPGIDKAQVFAGVRKLSDAAAGILLEHSASSTANTGTLAVFAPYSAGTGNYAFRSFGTAQVDAATASTFPAPITNVLTGLGDIAGDVATLRVNGVQAATSAADQGTGNYLAYPLYVGRRGGTTLPFNGRVYQMIVRFGANLDAATITDVETFVNSKTGAYGVSSDWFYTTLGTPTDLSLSPVPVLRYGFDTAGSVVTRSRNVRLTKRVRQAYPNQASFTSNQTALEYKVYDSDTHASKVASTAVAPKPIANWMMPSRLQVQSTVHWEILAFHQDACNLGAGGVGQQVASVRVRANNGTTATAWQTVSTTTPSTFVDGPNPVDVFQADLDVSGLADGTFWLEGEVFPWFGAAASVLKSEDQTAAREFSRRYYKKSATINYVYVASTGNDATGVVSTTEATALATPCQTISGALLRARTALGTTTVGALDGLRVRILDGVNTGPTNIAAFAPLRQDVAGVIIERAPGVARSAAVVTVSSTFRPFFSDTSGTLTEGSLIFSDVSVVLGGAFTLQGESARRLDVQFWNCNLNYGSFSTTLRSNSHMNFFGVAITNAPNTALGLITNTQIRILRGVTGSFGNGGYEAWLTVGSNLTAVSNPAYTDAKVNGHIWYNNKFLNPNATSTGPLVFAGATAANNGLDIGAMAMVQNLVELQGTNGNSSMRVAGDSDKGNLTHCVIMHNTLTGVEAAGRVNISYDEDPATARTHRNVAFKGNLVPQINVKGDDYAPISDGARTGHFEFEHGVNCSGNFSRNVDAAGGDPSFSQAYAGIGSVIAGGDPLFVNNQSVTKPAAVFVAGAGGGDYNLQAGSPARGDQEYPLLKYDLAGNLRGTGAQHAGCYQTA